jgi:hypothetical protein
MDFLTIVNRALVATGNNPVTLNDGTDEWQQAEIHWDRVVDDLLTLHSWPFARSKADLVATEGEESEKYDNAHALPAACLLLRAVYREGIKTEAYQVVGRAVYLDAESGVSAEFIGMPEDTFWHKQTIEVLTLMLEAKFYRGLNEDITAAQSRERDVENKLLTVRPIVDAENPPGPTYRGAATEARGRRRG